MRYEVSGEDIVKAKHPHEVFLINLIFNHVLLFVAFLSASSLQGFLFVVPIVSAAILVYLLWRARKSQLTDPWYVKCHWQLAARRSRFFILMLGLMALVILGVWLASGGNPGPQHYALGGVGIFPTMVTVLALIIMESEAMAQAGSGVVPKWLEERYPNPEARVLEE
ncbi:hypothetical protein [Thiohalomonas denitrificans]|uniref:Uncharacterized protein n=1 Tax=Thiohalomonas denitrificans TaxID=415747 RepID=A0A1G5QH68_9GAMM|nr:hypothetical protein [Thiohalomonas denitrificans]SCZ61032.1 hypothetical protein SAMN03097708_02074 [Thiohalomonas denitrificans]